MRARLADSCQGAELGSRPSFAAFYPELPHFPYRPYMGSEKGSEQAARRRPEKEDFAHEVWLQVLFLHRNLHPETISLENVKNVSRTTPLSQIWPFFASDDWPSRRCAPDCHPGENTSVRDDVKMVMSETMSKW